MHPPNPPPPPDAPAWPPLSAPPAQHTPGRPTTPTAGSPRSTPRPGPADDVEPADRAGRPVGVEVAPVHEEPIRRWVEGVLGWQVVDRRTSRLVPPTVHLVGPHANPPEDGAPRILVLDEGQDPPAVVVACQRLRPTAALVWPVERDELARLVSRVVAIQGGRDTDRDVLRVGGVAGGVGTTTVVLALAGLGGWQGRVTLAAVRGDAPASDLPVVPSEATAAPDLWSRLQPLSGVPSCRAVRISDPGTTADPCDPAIGFAVLDHGVDTDTDVAVCRMDAAALEQLPATTAAAIVIVGAGPLRPKALREATGGRPTILLPWSTRVARAGAHRRIPASLPGAWLRRLVPLLPESTEPRPEKAHRADVARVASGPDPPGAFSGRVDP